MVRLKQFARENWILLSLFVLAAAIALWFAAQFISQAIYFHDPRNRDVNLKSWMTPRYIVMTYELPREFVAETLELTDISQRKLSLGKIADELGLTMGELTEKVRAAAEEYRE